MLEAFALKRALFELRRVVAPLREVVGAVLRIDTRTLGADVDVEMRDVLDHVVRATDEIAMYREFLDSAVAVRQGLDASDQNDAMKVLTAWGAILLVPTIVTGVYGMNFRHMPELDWRLGYPWALALMIVTMLFLYAIFRRRGWLRPDGST